MQSHLSGSTDEPLIVVLQLMKTHNFRDTYSIRSCWYQTKLWINAYLPQSSDNIYKVVKFTDDETPIKNSISDCGSSQIEDVIDLTRKLYPNRDKHVGVRPTHENDERLNVKLPENKLRKVIKKEKKT
ncbi:hypothetical protein R3W88_024254 [Solanum pinnatisectum]|uniref:Uncharacterized protein n=1 Tax=Solanum pinnatisectum TaxID=50273 RepID=A0AAV9LZW3_9SOLN|nr:hypothetical protein R3W88_024254 [Solanum pinnatisectum]